MFISLELPKHMSQGLGLQPFEDLYFQQFPNLLWKLIMVSFTFTLYIVSFVYLFQSAFRQCYLKHNRKILISQIFNYIITFILTHFLL